MAKKTISETVRSIPLFRGCSDKELRSVESTLTQITVPAGRVLMNEGDSGHEFIIIGSGQAEVTRNGAMLAKLGPGDHAGELALLTDVPRTATVTALTDLTLEVIDRGSFRTLIRETPDIAVKMMASLADRLAAADDQVARLAN